MKNLRTISTLLLLLIASAFGLAPGLPVAHAASVEITDIDPASGATLDLKDRLYLKIVYESTIPLRFQMKALRQGVPLDVGIKNDSGSLHASGKGTALAWMQFINPTHIDEVRVLVYDAQWQEIYSLSTKLDIAWQELQTEQARQPAVWVRSLLKKDRRKSDFLFDPEPEKQDKLADFLFLLSIGSLPLYLFMQVQMLRRYRGRWRELAMVPLVTFMPLVLFTLTGGDVGSAEWITFIFRYVPFALFFLVILWVVKRVRAVDASAQEDD